MWRIMMSLKSLLKRPRNSSKSEDSALFLIVIWNAAGQAAEWRGHNEREKSKSSPKLRVGLPQFSTLGSVRGQYFKSCRRKKSSWGRYPKASAYHLAVLEAFRSLAPL